MSIAGSVRGEKLNDKKESYACCHGYINFYEILPETLQNSPEARIKTFSKPFLKKVYTNDSSVIYLKQVLRMVTEYMTTTEESLQP